MQKTSDVNVKKFYRLTDQLFMADIQNTNKENIWKLQNQWNIEENVIYVSPVLIDETGYEVGGFTNL